MTSNLLLKRLRNIAEGTREDEDGKEKIAPIFNRGQKHKLPTVKRPPPPKYRKQRKIDRRIC